MFANIWNTVFYRPLLNLMILLYHYLGNNLGLAILGIAVIVRIFLIPLLKKQKESSKKMASLKPELEKLQKKYANNKEKLAEEQVKLYRKIGYNPLGCVGTFLPQLIILSVLIGVIRAVTDSNLEGLYLWVRNLTDVTNGVAINTRFLFWDLTQSYKEVSSEFGKFAIQSIPYIGLSILVGVAQYYTTHFTQKMQGLTPEPKKTPKKKGDEPSTEEMQAAMQKSTMFLLPLMTVFLTISMPAALGWYWLIQSLLLVVQYFSINLDKTKKEIEKIKDKFKKK